MSRARRILDPRLSDERRKQEAVERVFRRGAAGSSPGDPHSLSSVVSTLPRRRSAAAFEARALLQWPTRRPFPTDPRILRWVGAARVLGQSGSTDFEPRRAFRGQASEVEALAALEGRPKHCLGAKTERIAIASPVEDDRLRLIFTCCHPALAEDARIALTLRALGGLAHAEGDRAGVFGSSRHDGAAFGAREDQDPASAHSLIGLPEAEAATREARCSFGGGLPDLQRGLRRHRRRRSSCAAELCAEAIRLGRVLRRTDARRARSRRPHRPDAAARRPPGRPVSTTTATSCS